MGVIWLLMGKRKRWMKTFSSVMQSIVGCITSTKNTNGTPFIRIWQNGSLSSDSPQNQNLDGQDELLGSRLKSYEVCLSDENITFSPPVLRDAAWYALNCPMTNFKTLGRTVNRWVSISQINGVSTRTSQPKFEPLFYEDVMEWKVPGWELPWT